MINYTKAEEINFLIKLNNIKNYNEKIRLKHENDIQVQKHKQNILELKKYMIEKNNQINQIIEQKDNQIKEKEKIIQDIELRLTIVEQKKSKNIFFKIWNKIFNIKKEL